MDRGTWDTGTSATRALGNRKWCGVSQGVKISGNVHYPMFLIPFSHQKPCLAVEKSYNIFFIYFIVSGSFSPSVMLIWWGVASLLLFLIQIVQVSLTVLLHSLFLSCGVWQKKNTFVFILYYSCLPGDLDIIFACDKKHADVKNVSSVFNI